MIILDEGGASHGRCGVGACKGGEAKQRSETHHPSSPHAHIHSRYSARVTPPPRPISPRVNGGTANRACATHPKHTTRFIRTPRQNLNLTKKSFQRCAERRRELGGYSRHVMMQLRNILCEKVWESFWRMMRKLRQVTPLINNFIKKMRRKAQGARRL